MEHDGYPGPGLYWPLTIKNKESGASCPGTGYHHVISSQGCCNGRPRDLRSALRALGLTMTAILREEIPEVVFTLALIL